MITMQTVKEYREYKRLAEEAQAMADAIADGMRAAMAAAGESRVVVGEYRITYADAVREALDRKRLEADLGDLSAYTKATAYKRFSVAWGAGR
jgi:predicted phage-related endonuclease